MKLIILLVALVISINALPTFYNLNSDKKNLRNFQQFVIHFISPTNFLANYAEWSIITHTGHDLIGNEFDNLFDKLSLASESKIRQAVSVLTKLLNDVSQLEGNNDDDYESLVSDAITKLQNILNS